MGETKVWKSLRGRVMCRDGFVMSVQASRTHTSVSCDDTGPYSAVEVGYPTEVESLLMTYQDAANIVDICEASPLYVCVSARVINEVIQTYGGMRYDSVTLPPQVELDEDGYEWVAAAVPPSSEESSETSTSEEEVTSVVHMGVSPPPPHTTTPPALGVMTPPQVLRRSGKEIGLSHQQSQPCGCVHVRDTLIINVLTSSIC